MVVVQQMADVKQGFCIEFCVNHQKFVLKNTEFFLKALYMTSWGHKPLIGINDSNVTQHGLRILEILVAHLQVGLTKMWKNCVKVIKEDRRRRINDVQRRLREDMTRKRIEKGSTQDWLLRHANMPDDTASSFQQLVTENNILSVPSIVESPNLAPCNIFLFQKMTIQVKATRFEDTADVKAEPQAMLDSITKVCSSDASSSVRSAEPSVELRMGTLKRSMPTCNL